MSRGPSVAQLPLSFRTAATARFETFVAGANGAALQQVAAFAAGAGGTLFLWGAAATGKSHLLQAACVSSSAAGRRAMYVPLDQAGAAGAEILTDLEALDLLALDGLEHVAGEPTWERRLFAVFEDVAARHAGLLLTARAGPMAVGLRLPDLASRVAAALVYRLSPLDDADRLIALTRHAHARGFELPPDVGEYLLTRVTRDMHALGRWLDELDRESLAQQQRLTIPFVRRVLAAGE